MEEDTKQSMEISLHTVVCPVCSYKTISYGSIFAGNIARKRFYIHRWGTRELCCMQDAGPPPVHIPRGLRPEAAVFTPLAMGLQGNALITAPAASPEPSMPVAPSDSPRRNWCHVDRVDRVMRVTAPNGASAASAPSTEAVATATPYRTSGNASSSGAPEPGGRMCATLCRENPPPATTVLYDKVPPPIATTVVRTLIYDANSVQL